MEQYYLQILLGVLSALILFIYGIENLSKEFQKLATERFSSLIAKLSKNRLTAALTGALSTAVIQSSSAVTVVVVVLVNTGILSFKNSLGVMFGTNVGTTVTAQLALIQSDILAPILIIVGFILRILGHRFALISKPIFFLGFILFALNLLSTSLDPLKDSPEVLSFFATLSNPLIAYGVSVLFTMLVQSSTVTSGMIVILAHTGLMPVEVAIPMILGSNLGSSTTAFIASLRLNLHARRSGVAKFVFNLLGTTIFMILLIPFSNFIQMLSANPATQAALAHLIFNILNASLFLILLSPFEKLIIFLVKGEEEEFTFQTKYLNQNGKRSFEKQVQDIKRELGYSIEITIKIFQKAISVFYHPSPLAKMDIEKLETLNDYLDNEITNAIVQLSKLKLSAKDARKTISLVKISNIIEQLGDLGRDFSEVLLKMHRIRVPKSDVDIEALTKIHNCLIELFKELEEIIYEPTRKSLQKIKSLEDEIHKEIQKQFDVHVEKLQENDRYIGNIFVDAISIIEMSVSKVRDIRRVLERRIRYY
jgi:phosphate:Na+ symporter